MRKLYNFVAFQIGWFACVLGAASAREALGIAVVAIGLAIHLVLARDRRRELAFLATSLPIGFVVDEVLHRAGAVVGNGTILPASFAPLWLLAMWPLFATTFGESMSWLRERHVLAAVLGVVAAPWSYMAAQRLDALELGAQSDGESWRWIVLVAITWGIALPTMTWLRTIVVPSHRMPTHAD